MNGQRQNVSRKGAFVLAVNVRAVFFPKVAFEDMNTRDVPGGGGVLGGAVTELCSIDPMCHPHFNPNPVDVLLT